MRIVKRTKREIETHKKKKKIVEEAIKLFVRFGYDRTTIKDISEATGYSIGSIYNFFGNKSGILSDSIKNIHRTAVEKMLLDKEKSENPKKVLLNYYYYIVDELERYGCDIVKAAIEATSEEYRFGGNREYRDVSLQALITFFQTIEENGKWKCNEPIELVSEQIQMQYIGIVSTWIYYPLHESLREAIEFNMPTLLDRYGL